MIFHSAGREGTQTQFLPEAGRNNNFITYRRRGRGCCVNEKKLLLIQLTEGGKGGGGLIGGHIFFQRLKEITIPSHIAGPRGGGGDNK